MLASPWFHVGPLNRMKDSRMLQESGRGTVETGVCSAPFTNEIGEELALAEGIVSLLAGVVCG